MALRPGFIIPNANTYAPDFKTAQPDQGDFLILGSDQTGVVAGGLVTLSGLTASLGAGPHIVVVDGVAFVLQANTNVSLAATGAQARWDLVIYDTTDGYTVLPGTPSDDPVFPDIGTSMVVLAAVYVPESGSGTTAHIIDKRNFLPRNVITQSSYSALVRSYDGTSVIFNIDGNGIVTWGTGTRLEKLSTGVLKVTREVQAETLTASVSATVAGDRVITAANIDWGPLGDRPSTPDTGMLWVDNATGEVYGYTAEDGWQSVGSTSRVGDVKLSFLAPEDEPGWLPLLGQTIAVSEAGGLPDQFPAWVTGSNITLPDARGMLPVGAGYLNPSNPGTVAAASGVRSTDHGTITKTVTTSELPAHTHTPGSNLTQSAGGHDHAVSVNSNSAYSGTVSSGGAHSHIIRAWSPFQEPTYGVRNSGTANASGSDVDTESYTATAGAHAHPFTVPSHTHTAATVPVNDHTHALPAHVSVGGGQPLLLDPPTLSFYFYIKY